MMTAIVMLLALLQAQPAAPSELPGWIAGSWRVEQGGIVTEEHWTAPSGNLMVGVSRTVTPGKKTAFEFLRIEKQGDKIVYIAQPGGRPPTSFTATSGSSKKIVFENPEHDFPQRVTYWRNEKGTLCARVDGKPNGKEVAEEWCWVASKLVQ